jgi:hypothetical protein
MHVNPHHGNYYEYNFEQFSYYDYNFEQFFDLFFNIRSSIFYIVYFYLVSTHTHSLHCDLDNILKKNGMTKMG